MDTHYIKLGNNGFEVKIM